MIINEIIPQNLYVENENCMENIKKYLKNQNNLNYREYDIQIGNWIEIYKNNKNYYIVKPADTISSIAQKLNLSEYELLNKIGTKKIYIGQRIDF